MSADDPVARADARAAEWRRTHKPGQGPLRIPWQHFAALCTFGAAMAIVAVVELFRFFF